MPAIPESTKTSLAQRLRAHAKASWPQLAQVHMRFRGQFAYATGELTDGEQIPLMRLRYGGSAHRWGTAIYVASKDSYEDQIWFSGSTEEIFDLVFDLHVANAGNENPNRQPLRLAPYLLSGRGLLGCARVSLRSSKSTSVRCPLAHPDHARTWARRPRPRPLPFPRFPGRRQCGPGPTSVRRR